ncbi:MAG: hypothetical protein WC299_10575 [Kiritimatiellia bacterium]
MAITPFQSRILKLLAKQRVESGESYVAGGVALNLLLSAPRRSRDIDLFHDTDVALAKTWQTDRQLLSANGLEVRILREAPSFVEAVIVHGGDTTAMQWARESAFRFFPLITDETMGLALHPFDLATNKVLAMAGRLEVRDWVDVLRCDASLQPFGYLAWAACGKDPGYNPRSLMAAASRLHYSQAEVDTLDFHIEQPDAARLGAQWHAALSESDRIISILPPAAAGKCVVTRAGQLFRGSSVDLAAALKKDETRFHDGRIGGSWPRVFSTAL